MMTMDAVSCYVELHGFGFSYGRRQMYRAVVINGVTYDNATSGRGIYTYSVEPSSCSATDYQHFETHAYKTASPSLVSYLQALTNGRFFCVIVLISRTPLKLA